MHTRHSMTGKPPSGVRAIALMAALFAVTLNFLQPLAHAAAMRDGDPTQLWTMFCSSTAADPGKASKSGPAQTVVDSHECCLGLAHAAALLAPLQVSLSAPLPEFTGAAFLPADLRPAAAIRDGPHRPRGPPSLV